MIAPYLRDDGSGGLQLVIARGAGESECLALSPAVALTLIEGLAGWLARRQRVFASQFPPAPDASPCQISPPSSRR